MSEKPYGVLLIAGGQTHQENYARAFAADSRCRLVGLTDEADVPERRRALNAQLAAELGVPVLESLDEALARDDVDLVSVCTEPERRGRVAARCARAGKHLYVDKPLTTNLDDARELLAAARAHNVHTQMFSLVRVPLASRAKTTVESGRFGALTALHCDLTFAKGIAGSAELGAPRSERAVADRFTWIDSKRELYCVGLYPLVLFQWLTGRRFTSVYAATANYFFAEHQRNGVEDFGNLLLEMEGGLHATITVGRTGWSSHPDYGIHQLQLTGTDETVRLDAFRPRLEIYSDAAPWRQPATPHPEDPMGFWASTQEPGGIKPKTDWIAIERPVQSDAAAFLDCLDADRESDVPASTGAHAVQVILAAYRSAAEKRWVEIPPLA
jgi:predicted dehydrogenase